MASLPSRAFESFETIQIGDCLIKISKYFDQIQVFLFNMLSGESAIDWFHNEMEAYMWIEYMSAKYV
jgi:hypothetical protein